MASTTCKTCGGTGRCAKCNGVGSFDSLDHNPAARRPCHDCHCTGRCPHCGVAVRRADKKAVATFVATQPSPS